MRFSELPICSWIWKTMLVLLLLPRHHLSLFLPTGPWNEFCFPALRASMPERNSRHSNNPSLVCSFLHSTTASKPHKKQNSHRQTESVEKERRKISDGPPNTTTRKKKHTHRHARMKWSPREKEEDSPGEEEKQNKNKNSFFKKNQKLSKKFHKKLRNRAHSDCQLLNCSVERTD